ncbi:MAG: amino acid adenylation domain-containing protein, partial [bacterium]|nr:amino acid adenylation domain-containing protein [bacterium]
ILQQMEIGTTGYNMPYTILQEDKIDKKKLEIIFRTLLGRHESLRTSFHMVNEKPVQKIHDTTDFKIDYYKTTEEEAETIITEFTRPFDLSKAPLLRVGLVEIAASHRQALLIDMHHITTDGTSQEILKNEFAALYAETPLPPIKLQYRDYSEWQNRKEQQQLVKQQERYWISQFSDELPVLNLPLDYSRPVIQSFEGASVSFVLTGSETRTLKGIARELDATLYMVVLALYTVLLFKLSGQEDIIVGTPIAARRHADLQNFIGMFVNTLGMRTFPAGNKTIDEFLVELKERVLGAFENQEYQFEDLVEKVSVQRNPGRNPLFDVMFNLLNQSESSRDVPEPLEQETYEHKKAVAKFDLVLTGVDMGEYLFFNLAYSTKLFKANTIERIIRYSKNIVSGVMKNKKKKLFDLVIISDEETKQLLYDFNDTDADYPKNKTIHELFEEQVKKTPDNIALVDSNHKNTRYPSITYRVLNEKANQLTKVLQKKGITPGSIVAIVTERSIRMIIGIIAVLKTGSAYLPIALNLPLDRISYMLRDSSAKLVLSQKSTRDRFPNNYETLYLDDRASEVESKENPEKVNTPDHPAYIIYTSGSTGKPKGVSVEHRSLVYYVLWGLERYLQGTPATFPLYTSISFDLTVTSIYLPLVSGGKIIIYRDRPAQLPIQDVIDDDEVEVIKATPAHLRVMVHYQKGLNSRLKKIIVGGEELPAQLTREIYRLFDGMIEIYNEYGPTEATVGCMTYLFSPKNDKHAAVPIGIPVNNAKIYILDKGLFPVPMGVTGEIYVGGEILARGYLNQPLLTAEKFITNPYFPSSRLYRTGDLGWRLSNGNIVFAGRMDGQVKIRGYRVETGEIEALLLEHAHVREAFVLAGDDGSGGKELWAYIIPTAGFENTIAFNEELRKKLSGTLPDYMIPAHFVGLDKIPLTPNGKVDRKALPKPEVTAGDSYIAPRNEIEEKVTEIWSGILGIEKTVISVDANFFQLGGHSLKATIMASNIHKELNSKVPLAEIFKSPTIRGIAQYIKEVVKEKHISIEPVEKKEYYAVSSPQKRL